MAEGLRSMGPGAFMSMKERDVYEKAIEFWGRTRQIDKAIEEMAELTKALLKHRLESTQGNKRAVQKEIIDVLFMLNQLMIIFPGNYRRIFQETKDLLLKRIGL